MSHHDDEQGPVVLSFQHVDKVFGDTRAVDDVSFDCRGGEIVALLGENGAGKSTLIKILAGVYKRDGGRLLFRGTDVDSGTTSGEGGIAFIHQDLGLIDWMTVAENMAIGSHFQASGLLKPFSVRRTEERAQEALTLVGCDIDVRRRVFDLSRAEKSLLAIARALTQRAGFLVLDEPTASLPHADAQRLFDVLRRLRGEGVGMIYVSHRLDEVFEISDRVVVMRNGRLVGDVPIAAATPASVVSMIVGHELAGLEASAAPGSESSARVELVDALIEDVGPVDLAVRTGEIVGLVGLRGAGHETVGRAIAGVCQLRSGALRIDGTAVAFHSPRDAARAGVSFATSNRESEGLVNGLSVRENIFVNPGMWGRRISNWSTRKAERARALQVMERFGVRPNDSEKVADTLSGGNQQKVMLARWIGIPRTALVLEEPTMGVDVGAKADIYRLLGEVIAQGTSIVVVSTDFEEIASICHRAVVFSRGVPVAELTGTELSVSTLLAAASGLSTEGISA